MKDEQDWRAQVILALFARAKCVVWLGLSRKHAPAPNDHYVESIEPQGAGARPRVRPVRDDGNWHRAAGGERGVRDGV